MYSQARLIFSGHLAAQLTSLGRRIRRGRNALTRLQPIRQTNGSRALLNVENGAQKNNNAATLEMIKNEAQPAKENAAYAKPAPHFTKSGSGGRLKCVQL